MKDDLKYVLHILECIRRIEEDVAGGRNAFDGSHTAQDAVLRNLHVIAESAKRLSQNFKSAHADIDWAGITGLRNRLVHDYLGVDLEIVWGIVCEDVPVLKSELNKATSSEKR